MSKVGGIRWILMSLIFEVCRMSLEEKIGIRDQKVLLAKLWRSGDSK